VSPQRREAMTEKRIAEKRMTEKRIAEKRMTEKRIAEKRMTEKRIAEKPIARVAGYSPASRRRRFSRRRYSP
jgi:hypothetical protein